MWLTVMVLGGAVILAGALPARAYREEYVLHKRIVSTAVLRGPIDLVFAADESELFVACQASSRVEVFSRRGDHLRGWDVRSPLGKEAFPEGLTRAANDHLYVTATWFDKHNKKLSSLMEFDQQGKLLQRWEKPGGVGNHSPFALLRGLAIDTQDVLCVAEYLRSTRRELRLRLDATYLGEWRCDIPTHSHLSSSAVGVAIAPDDTAFVLEGSQEGQVHKYGADGADLGHLPRGFGFHNPQGICVDRHGQVYVTDTGWSEVVKMNSAGDTLARFGRGANGAEVLKYAAGLAVGSDGLVYVADRWGSCVAVFCRKLDTRLRGPFEPEAYRY